jgi:ribbon-helix-helix protein
MAVLWRRNAGAMTTKKRRTILIAPDILEKLRAIKARTGLSESEQIRQGIEWWLAAREWPPRKSDAADMRSKIVPDRVRKRRWASGEWP